MENIRAHLSRLGDAPDDSSKTDRITGVICDQAIRLKGFYVSKDYPEHLRRIRYQDPETGKTFVFLTNNTTLPPLTIAALYKSRWQVERFFKWIKQHLYIKRFLGTSEHAVKAQIGCAVSTCVLIAMVKKELHLNASPYTLSRFRSGLKPRPSGRNTRYLALKGEV